MAVSRNDAGGNSTGTGSGEFCEETGFTVPSGSNNCLVVGVTTTLTGTTNFAAFWDQDGTPQAMTLVVELSGIAAPHTGLFCLKNPTPGNLKLHVQWTTSSAALIGMCNFKDVDTFLEAGSDESTANPHSLNVGSSSDGATVTVLGVYANDVNSVDSPQTEVWRLNAISMGLACGQILGGTTNTHAFTKSGTAASDLLAVHLTAAAGGATLMGQILT
jgi:hypothetical protein